MKPPNLKTVDVTMWSLVRVPAHLREYRSMAEL
jgi:hypothetical protein